MASKVADRVAELSERDLAYLAGLVDGEGCFSLKRHLRPKRDHFSFELAVGMCSPEVEKVAEHYGFGTVYYRQPQHEGWKGTCVWKMSGGILRSLLPRLLPLLRFKREQAEIGLVFLRQHGFYRRGRSGDVATSCYLSMKKLNRKGVANGV